MNRYFKMVIATALIGVTTSANAIDRKTLAQYASSLNGLKKEQLKAALHKLMDKKNVLPYGGGGKGTWWGFWYTTEIRKPMSAIIAIVTRSFSLKAQILVELLVV